MKFEQDFETLIINPAIKDIRDYKVKFDESFDNILYFAQTRGYSDDNDYHSYILFEKDNKLFCFHEFDNPQHLSFFVNCEESNNEKFFTMLNSFDEINGQKFFNNAKIHYDYSTLNEEIKENNSKIKKNKI